uniref:Rho GTPase activating protein 44 n=1 Tax=Rousettus aegyptiacus TaxID=9407 RepID=A0A7J8G454_ROUAE|nr:Rho GTPase activating protein 44 [Rousettus aegyptiacus]
MTPSNMAIVLGPNLLWPQAEGNITEMMTTVSLQIVGIIEPIIQHADWFFPGGMWWHPGVGAGVARGEQKCTMSFEPLKSSTTAQRCLFYFVLFCFIILYTHTRTHTHSGMGIELW